MSLIQAVIESAETVAVANLLKELPELAIKSQNLKQRILEYLTKIYVYVETKVSLKNIKEYSKETNQLLTHHQTLQTSYAESVKNRDLLSQLESVAKCLTTCQNICLIQEGLQKFTNDSFPDETAIENILRLTACWKEIEENPIRRHLFNDISLYKTLLEIKLEDCAKHAFDHHSKTVEGIDVHVISIKKQPVRQLQLIAKYDGDFHILGNFLEYYRGCISDVTERIVRCSTIMTVEEGDFMVCKLEVNNKCKDEYDEVLGRLAKFFEFLRLHLDYVLNNGETLMMRIGREIRGDLNKILIKRLQNVIIASMKDDAKFNQVITHIELFQKNMTQNSVFASDTTELLDYANKKHLIVIDKKCQDYRRLAMDIMKKDFSNTTTVGTASDSAEYAPGAFAKCTISSSVLELLQLVENIMLQSVGCPEIYSKHLYGTAKNILFQYPIVVKEMYGDRLMSSAEHAAIFHNNCSYINHDISTGKWHEIHKKLSSSAEVKLAQFDFIRKHMQTFANGTFQNYVRAQMNSLREFSDLQRSSWDHLEKMRSLKTIWRPLLNPELYKGTMTLLLDSMCKRLCEKIFDLKSTMVIEDLIEVCREVRKAGPELFADVADVDSVQHWRKLSELDGMLETENIECWRDGKGTEQFSLEEIKQLINLNNENNP